MGKKNTKKDEQGKVGLGNKIKKKFKEETKRMIKAKKINGGSDMSSVSFTGLDGKSYKEIIEMDMDEISEEEGKEVHSKKENKAKKRKKINEPDYLDKMHMERLRHQQETEEKMEASGVKKELERQQNLLPIKTADGKVIRPKIKMEKQKEFEVVEESDVETDQEDESVASEEDAYAKGEAAAQPLQKIDGFGEYSEVQDKVDAAERIQESLEKLATIATLVLQDPETNFSQLKGVKALFTDPNLEIRKFAYLTQLSIFKDILPSYYIRALTDEEKKTKVSKEVRKLRVFEEFLVSSYQSFIKNLKNQYKACISDGSQANGLKLVIVKCICELLVSKPNFNFSDQLIEIVAKRLATVNEDQTFNIVVDAAKSLIDQDQLGSITLELLTALTRTIQTKLYKVSPKVIDIFLNLDLHGDVGKSDGKDSDHKPDSKPNGIKIKRSSLRQEHVSKNMKKRLKANRVIEEELQEASAEFSSEERKKVHTQLLTKIFIVYFRTLKHAPNPNLLPAVLRGLAKFSHLINVDFFFDVLAQLKRIVDPALVSKEPLLFEPSLHMQLLATCCAFELTSGQGEALNLDLYPFYNWLYRKLPEIAMGVMVDDYQATKDQSEKKLGDLLLETIDHLFFRRRDQTPVRAAAFCKRLASLSFHLPSAYSVKTLQRYVGLDRLLASDQVDDDGVYQLDGTDLNLAAPFATHLYELKALYTTHYDDKVRSEAKKVINTATVKSKFGR